MKLRLVSLVALSTVMLAGCFDKTLDFRNAEISNGKVFEKKENKPFSGLVTNVPIELLSLQKLYPATAFIYQVLGKEVLHFDVTGAYCDIKVNDGILNGATTCGRRGSNLPALTIPYEQGVINGTVIAHTQNKDQPAAEIEFRNDTLEGIEKVYWPATGTLVGQLPWKNGQRIGMEEVRFASNGKTNLTRIWAADKKEGLTAAYDEDGKLIAAEYWFDSNKIDAVPATSQEPLISGASCIEEWKIGYQLYKRHDPDARMNDWELLCQNGYAPRRSSVYENLRHDGPFRGVGPYGTATFFSKGTTSDASSTCLDSWTKAYRKEVGQDAIVTTAQIGEWEEWCKQGKRP